ncbi:hsc70-interacting protein-like [Convolutriloba macropyga]|uniref:hsc70-interacting protein-like n=1 Tax=Convolutriloba macropyga TaxID=536237 RepID=UPI003F524A3B
MDPTHILLLEQFVGLLKQKPEIIHEPNLRFFKDYLINLGATLPPKPEPPGQEAPKSPEAPKEEETVKTGEPLVEEVEEDEIPKPEFDMSYVIEEGEYEEVELPDEVEDISEEMMDKSGELRGQAMSALSDGDLEEALKLFTEAVKCNSSSAPILAKRASVLCKLKRPSAALKDCDRALTANPDSAQALMWRGRANMLLGNFEIAQNDFSQSARIDSNETLEDWIRENKSNATKMRDYNVAVERQKTERKIEERKERIRKAKEENEKAAREAAEGGAAAGGMPDFGAGGFPGAGAGVGMPGNLQDILGDPEILVAMQDPEVMNAFMDVQKDPSNISKYEDNPKVQKVLEKLATKFGGAAGGDFGV